MRSLVRYFGHGLACAALASAAAGYAQQPANCSTGPVPDRPLALSIGAEKVPTPPLTSMRKIGVITSGDESFDQYAVSVADKDMFANIEVQFSVLVPKGQQPDGRTFRKLPGRKTVKQPGPQEGLPEVQSWSVKDKSRKLDASHVGFVASLRAEFGKRRGNVLPGRVYLCVPGGQTSSMFGEKLPDPITLVGRFEAQVR